MVRILSALWIGFLLFLTKILVAMLMLELERSRNCMLKFKKAKNKHRKHAEFKEGDMVWIHPSKDRFPKGKYGKLKTRADGPFKVLQRIGENAYKIGR
ncbi:hypothetical protein JRO89_XS06G0192400 [Xanthoceras sorbifolium]|uniref:Tf2-1-like SH3-like domain-containing protein n=1 Tax=Xanthoceras sorbifolium TaxID=99658 RepID=A0ABQ8HYX2_9ROSI|nr:hypothetical protein JRO89_XS06G0192400 [Xanthoceras sorbifolium]